jgi:hypothetical protein
VDKTYSREAEESKKNCKKHEAAVFAFEVRWCEETFRK